MKAVLSGPSTRAPLLSLHSLDRPISLVSPSLLLSISSLTIDSCLLCCTWAVEDSTVKKPVAFPRILLGAPLWCPASEKKFIWSSVLYVNTKTKFVHKHCLAQIYVPNKMFLQSQLSFFISQTKSCFFVVNVHIIFAFLPYCPNVHIKFLLNCLIQSQSYASAILLFIDDWRLLDAPEII